MLRADVSECSARYPHLKRGDVPTACHNFPGKVLLHLKVFELGPIVASYLLHLELKLILSSPEEAFEGPLGFILILQKEHPNEAGKVINDN